MTKIKQIYSDLCGLCSSLSRNELLNREFCFSRIRSGKDLEMALHHLQEAAKSQKQSFQQLYWTMRHLRFLLRISATYSILEFGHAVALLWRKGWISLWASMPEKQVLSNIKIAAKDEANKFSVAAGSVRKLRIFIEDLCRATRPLARLGTFFKRLFAVPLAGCDGFAPSSFPLARKETMPENLITCHCQTCNGKIKFDANQLGPDGTMIVECPHCKLETKLFKPRSSENAKGETANEMTSKVLAKELALRIYRAKGIERFEHAVFGITRLFAVFWAIVMVLILILLTLTYITHLFSKPTATADVPQTFTGSIMQSQGWQDFGILFMGLTFVLTMLSIISIVLAVLTIERNSRKETETST